MTEDEAKTKWCPFVRLYNDEEGSWDNRGNSWHNQFCIASDCMAWRSIFKPDWSNTELTYLDKEDGGYCGLAGK